MISVNAVEAVHNEYDDEDFSEGIFAPFEIRNTKDFYNFLQPNKKISEADLIDFLKQIVEVFNHPDNSKKLIIAVKHFGIYSKEIIRILAEFCHLDYLIELIKSDKKVPADELIQESLYYNKYLSIDKFCNFINYASDKVKLDIILDLDNIDYKFENFISEPEKLSTIINLCHITSKSDIDILINKYYDFIFNTIVFEDEALGISDFKKYFAPENLLKYIDIKYIIKYLLYNYELSKDCLLYIYKKYGNILDNNLFKLFIENFPLFDYWHLIPILKERPGFEKLILDKIIKRLRKNKGIAIERLIENDFFQDFLRLYKNIQDKDLFTLIDLFIKVSQSLASYRDSNDCIDMIIVSFAQVLPHKTKQINNYLKKFLNIPNEISKEVNKAVNRESEYLPLELSLTSAALENKDIITTVNFADIISPWISEYFYTPYLSIKKKTPKDIYNEGFKKNPFILNNLSNYNNYIREIEYILSKYESDFLNYLISESTNYEQFIKYANRVCNLAVIHHNNNQIPLELIHNIILNKSISTDKDYIKQFLDIYTFIRIDSHVDMADEDIDKILKIDPNIIDKEKFKNALNKFNELEDKITSVEKVDFNKETLTLLKYLQTEVFKIKNISSLLKYYKTAQPKVDELYKLDLSFNGIDFKALKYRDPYAFAVGIDTDCCQRIGGPGEASAVDSFINPLASVLTVYKDNLLLAQSYFHFVPEDNGYILDNIEGNVHNVKKTGVNLTSIYKEYAEKIKQKYPDIKYLKVGLAYTKIDTRSFPRIQEESDPRKFSVKKKYSDYKENNHIDLFIPNEVVLSFQINQIVKFAKLFEILVHE